MWRTSKISIYVLLEASNGRSTDAVPLPSLVLSTHYTKQHYIFGVRLSSDLDMMQVYICVSLWCVVWCLSCTVVCSVVFVMYSGVLYGVQVMYHGVLCGVQIMYSGALCGVGHAQWCVVWYLSCTVVCCVVFVIYSGVLCCRGHVHWCVVWYRGHACVCWVC